MSQTRQVPLCCPGHSRPVVFLEYSGITPDGYFFVSACKDGKPMIREGSSGDWIGTFEGHKGAVWGCSIDAKGLKVATASGDFTAKIWDAITGDEKHSYTHPHIVRSVQMSKDGKIMVTGCNDKIIRLFDLENFNIPPFEFVGHTTAVRVILLDEPNQKILSSGEDKSFRIWNCLTQSLEKEVATVASVTSMEFSKIQPILALTCGTFVQLWDVNNYTLTTSIDIKTPVESVALHPTNPKFLVAGGEDMWLHLYDLDNGEIGVLKGHFGPVHCIRFAPDGESFSSGSEDGTIRIWQTNPRINEETTKEETFQQTNQIGEVETS